jgi:hypothetical protein
VRVDTFEVCEDDVAVEGVMVVETRVLDDCVGNCFVVVAGENTAAARTRLLVAHRDRR